MLEQPLGNLVQLKPVVPEADGVFHLAETIYKLGLLT